MRSTTSVGRRIQMRLDDLRSTLLAEARPWSQLPSLLASWSGWSTSGRMLAGTLSVGLKVAGVALAAVLVVPAAVCVLLLTASHRLSEKVKSGSGEA